MINYYLITKPGIIFGNLVTVAAGFLLASSGPFNYFLFLATLLGLAFIIASACIFNNYIDRHIDEKMARTKNRPLVTGSISVKKAIVFAILLGLLGLATLLYFTNLTTTLIALSGFSIYVLLYSFVKSKTTYATLIGSVAGAVPPVVGYCAVTNSIDAGAIILFAILVLWQMPHFFAIALYRAKEYANAAIPVLPVKKGNLITKKQMTYYILGFIGACLLLTLYGYTGYIYFAVSALLGLSWLLLCLRGFKAKNDILWGKSMFRFSLVVIMALCTAMIFKS